MTLPGDDPRRCEGRYLVPQTAPPRDEPFDVTYRCAMPKGHDGPHGAGNDSPQPIDAKSFDRSQPIDDPRRAAIRQWVCEKCDKPVDKEAWRRGERALFCDGECDCRCWGPGPNPDCPAHPNGW
jgi:hypothetical protein